MEWQLWGRRFARLTGSFKSPFTDLHAQRPLADFPPAEVTAMVEALAEIRQRAVGYRTAKNFIAIAYLRLSRLKNLPAHPFSAAAPIR